MFTQSDLVAPVSTAAREKQSIARSLELLSARRDGEVQQMLWEEVRRSKKQHALVRGKLLVAEAKHDNLLRHETAALKMQLAQAVQDSVSATKALRRERAAAARSSIAEKAKLGKLERHVDRQRAKIAKYESQVQELSAIGARERMRRQREVRRAAAQREVDDAKGDREASTQYQLCVSERSLVSAKAKLVRLRETASLAAAVALKESEAHCAERERALNRALAAHRDETKTLRVELTDARSASQQQTSVIEELEVRLAAVQHHCAKRAKAMESLAQVAAEDAAMRFADEAQKQEALHLAVAAVKTQAATTAAQHAKVIAAMRATEKERFVDIAAVHATAIGFARAELRLAAQKASANDRAIAQLRAECEQRIAVADATAEKLKMTAQSTQKLLQKNTDELLRANDELRRSEERASVCDTENSVMRSDLEQARATIVEMRSTSEQLLSESRAELRSVNDTLLEHAATIARQKKSLEDRTAGQSGAVAKTADTVEHAPPSTSNDRHEASSKQQAALEDLRKQHARDLESSELNVAALREQHAHDLLTQAGNFFSQQHHVVTTLVGVEATQRVNEDAVARLVTATELQLAQHANQIAALRSDHARELEVQAASFTEKQRLIDATLASVETVQSTNATIVARLVLACSTAKEHLPETSEDELSLRRIAVAEAAAATTIDAQRAETEADARTQRKLVKLKAIVIALRSSLAQSRTMLAGATQALEVRDEKLAELQPCPPRSVTASSGWAGECTVWWSSALNVTQNAGVELVVHAVDEANGETLRALAVVTHGTASGVEIHDARLTPGRRVSFTVMACRGSLRSTSERSAVVSIASNAYADPPLPSAEASAGALALAEKRTWCAAQHCGALQSLYVRGLGLAPVPRLGSFVSGGASLRAIVALPAVMVNVLRLAAPHCRPTRSEREAACRASSIEASGRLKVHLQRGIHPDLRDVHDRLFSGGVRAPLLFIAAWDGELAKVTTLLSAGADVNGTTLTGETALYAAAAMGHSRVVDALLRAGAEVDCAEFARGCTALYAAAECGRVTAVRVLLHAGADVDVRSQEGHTALYAAASEGHPDVVRLLLNAGADNDAACGDDGETPRKAARRTGVTAAFDRQQPLKIGDGFVANAAFVQHGGGQAARTLTNAVAGRFVPIDRDVGELMSDAAPQAPVRSVWSAEEALSFVSVVERENATMLVREKCYPGNVTRSPAFAATPSPPLLRHGVLHREDGIRGIELE